MFVVDTRETEAPRCYLPWRSWALPLTLLGHREGEVGGGARVGDATGVSPARATWGQEEAFFHDNKGSNN
jgi:hypothetical protein